MTPAHAQVPTPCDLPGGDRLCDLPGDVVGGVASAAGDAVMQGVTSWVVNAALWLLEKVGEAMK